MRGTGDWGPNERPESWRQTMLYLYPNGQLTLTAITSMLPTEKVTDPTFHWWTKTLPTQAGPANNLYNDPLLSVEYEGGAQEGTTVYVQVDQKVASEFRPGHTAMLRRDGDYRHDTRGKVTNVIKAGGNSVIAVRLLHTPDSNFDIDEATHIKVIGNMNAEGATMPEAISYNPVYLTNKTQIFRTPLSLTRTALRTRLRTVDQYKEAKREALEMHGIEIEKSFLWGKMYEGIGDNGKPERATNGLVTAIVEEVPDNVDAFHLNPDYAGKSWIEAGEEWLDLMFERIYRYGSGEKMAVVGSMVLLALKNLARAGAQVNMEMGEISYGIKVVNWMTPFGSVYLKTHPLFSYDPATRGDMLIFEPRNLRTRVIDDTFFVEDPMDRKNRNHSKDGREEEYITEIGLEYHDLPSAAYLSGFGRNNTLEV